MQLEFPPTDVTREHTPCGLLLEGHERSYSHRTILCGAILALVKGVPDCCYDINIYANQKRKEIELQIHVKLKPGNLFTLLYANLVSHIHECSSSSIPKIHDSIQAI